MRKLVILAAVLLGLTIGGSASAASVDDAAAAEAAIFTPQTFTVGLLPSGDPQGSGTAILTVDLGSGTVCYEITVTGIGVPTEPVAGIGNAHIHSYAENGAIAVDLMTEFSLVGGTTDTYRASDCVTADRRTLVDILLHPELYYINVHTTEFPGGAIQGDLG
jgi:hypothetical protein